MNSAKTKYLYIQKIEAEIKPQDCLSLFKQSMSALERDGLKKKPFINECLELGAVLNGIGISGLVLSHYRYIMNYGNDIDDPIKQKSLLTMLVQTINLHLDNMDSANTKSDLLGANREECQGTTCGELSSDPVSPVAHELDVKTESLSVDVDNKPASSHAPCAKPSMDKKEPREPVNQEKEIETRVNAAPNNMMRMM